MPIGESFRPLQVANARFDDPGAGAQQSQNDTLRDTENQQVSSVLRRKILKEIVNIAIVGGGVGGVGVAAYFAKNHYDSQQSQQYESADVDDLNATATTVTGQGRIETFQPDAEFTKEIFDQVQSSVFVLEVDDDKDPPSLGTAWMIHRKPSSKSGYVENTFATAAHLLTNEYTRRVTDITKITITQPYNSSFEEKGQDVSFFLAPNPGLGDPGDKGILTVVQPDTDIGINNYNLLAYQDNYTPRPNDKMLIVGFPGEYMGQGLMDSLTQGVVVSVQDVDSSTGVWTINALSDYGVSGAPVFIIRDGKPLVVGMVVSKYLDQRDLLSVTPLDMAPLIRKLG